MRDNNFFLRKIQDFEKVFRTYHNIAVNGRRRRHVLVHELVGRGCRVAIELLLGSGAVPFLLATGNYIVEFLFGG